MVVFDATFLSHLLYPESRLPLDPSTKQPVARAKERIEYLIETLWEAKQKIVIPTPALSELLAVVSKPQELLEKINSSRWFEIYPFDQRAAIECAEFVQAAIKSGGKKSLPSTWAKAKFDWQIIAIAIVVGADTIYSDDEDIPRYLAGKPLKVLRVSDLPAPPPQQMPLPDVSTPNTEQEE
jgi:predicted nucleic acid-binding protein